MSNAKNRRMGVGCVIMTIKRKSKVCGMQKKEQNGAGMRNNDPKGRNNDHKE